MKTIRYFYPYGFFVLGLALMMLFTSCGSGDESSVQSDDLLGSWIMSNTTFDDQLVDAILTFKNETDFSLTYRALSESYTYVIEGTFAISGEILSLHYDSYSENENGLEVDAGFIIENHSYRILLSGTTFTLYPEEAGQILEYHKSG